MATCRFLPNAQGLLDLLLSLSEPGSTSGAHRIDIEHLYDYGLIDVEHALLQVMHTVCTHRCDRTEECLLALRKFLCRVAAQSLVLGLRMCWTVDAVAPILEKGGFTGAIDGLRDMLEAATVNRASLARTRASGSSSAMASPTAAMDDAGIARHAARKQERSAVFNDVRSFVRELIEISDYLPTIADRPRRKPEMRARLADLDTRVGGRRIFMPLAASADRPAWVVRILPNECVVFSSRERAPFLLWVETIDDPDEACTCGDAAMGRDGHPTGIDFPATPRAATPVDRQASSTDAMENSRDTPLAATNSAGDVDMMMATSSSMGNMSVASTPGGGAAASSDSPPRDDAAAAGSKREVDCASVLRYAFGELAAERLERLRAASPYGGRAGWSARALVVKAGDDLRQEDLALQLIDLCHRIFIDKQLSVFVQPYGAMPTTFNGGIIELVSDAKSIDSLKKSAGVQTLHQFFAAAYGAETGSAYRTAQRNFVESMAGYSVVCYLLQIKDRHNGNLMLSRTGRLIHIDFGFMFATSPGGMNFESAPFKLSSELLGVMGGQGSPSFAYFKVLLFQAFVALRERAGELLGAVECTLPGTNLPCYGNDGPAVLAQMRQRLALDLATDPDVARLIRQMVDTSTENWRTKQYDRFQTWQNGII
jgi:phosphatidylinositol 4-kinase